MRRSPIRRLLLSVAFALYAIVLLEVAARAFLALEWQVSFFQPRDVIYRYYPELVRVAQIAPQTDDGHFDVLILGASVMNDTWGNIAELLAAGYTYRESRPVRVHNLSRPAHSSLDSYYKYLNLAGARFDLVVLYHGINEVRANNAPGDVYRSDYSHYHWYDQVNRVHAHRELGVLAFPYVVTDLLPNVALLLTSFVRKEAVLSSMIEGTQSSLADLMLLGPFTSRRRPLRYSLSSR